MAGTQGARGSGRGRRRILKISPPALFADQPADAKNAPLLGPARSRRPLNAHQLSRDESSRTGHLPATMSVRRLEACGGGRADLAVLLTKCKRRGSDAAPLHPCARQVRGLRHPAQRAAQVRDLRRSHDGRELLSRSHPHRRGRRRKRQTWRAGYRDPEYARNRARRYVHAHGRCEDCGRPLKGHLFSDGARWECDHAVALSDGGSNAEDNLRCRCLACHYPKTAHDRRSRGQGGPE